MLITGIGFFWFLGVGGKPRRGAAADTACGEWKAKQAPFRGLGGEEKEITDFLCVLKFAKNVYQIGFFIIFAAEFQKQETMEVVSTREFRANQKKYFGMASKGEDVILKSRNWGSFRLIPISQNDIVTNKPDLTERICQAIREVKLMREGKIKELSMDELLDEL